MTVTSPNLNRLISEVTRMTLASRERAGRPLRGRRSEVVAMQIDSYVDLRETLRLDGREDLTDLEAEVLVEMVSDQLRDLFTKDCPNG
jgi:hypothetical protein